MLILTQDTLSFWRWQQQGVLLSFLSHIKLQSSVLTAASLYFMVSREVCCQLRAHRDEISLSALLCCGIWWGCNISKGALFHPTTIPPSWVSSYTLNQIVQGLTDLLCHLCSAQEFLSGFTLSDYKSLDFGSSSHLVFQFCVPVLVFSASLNICYRLWKL